MNRLSSIALGLALTSATIFFGTRWLTREPAPTVTAPLQPASLPAPGPVKSTPRPTLVSPDDMPAILESPELQARLRHIEEQFGVHSETEIVEGIRVRKDRNCTVKVHYLDNGDGTTRTIHSCEPNEPREQDIYETYSTDALEALAYSDDHAAYVLAKRFNHSYPERALEYAIRSTALSGNVEPIAWMTSHYHIPYKKNGIVQLRSVEDKYVLSGVAYALSNDDNISGHSLRFIRASEHQQDGVDIQALDLRITEVLAEIDRIRHEVGVAGNTTNQ